MASLHYLIWLSTRRSLRAEQAIDLIHRFGSAEAVYFSDPAEYGDLSLGQSTVDSLRNKSMDEVEEILADCDRLNLRILTCQDAAYPERLLQLPDYPLTLYIRGKLFRFDEELAIGMVGSRECSEYGKRMAGQFAFDLTRSGALVVSGMAQGIDACSLKGALKAGGTPVSVVAGGVDVVYPWSSRWLYEDVSAAGAVLSEYPPGTRPDGWRFPVRNRIISGLSAGVVAVEAARNSGTLITADKALEQNRDVFAVPGPADAPMSAGTNWLISRGYARLVQSAGDILEEYLLRFPEKLSSAETISAEERQARLAEAPEPVRTEKPRRSAERRQEHAPEPEKPEKQEKQEKPEADPAVLSSLADQEKEILALLFEARLTADEIIGRTEIPARRVNSALTVLQVRGLITECPGRRFEAAVRPAAQTHGYDKHE